MTNTQPEQKNRALGYWLKAALHSRKHAIRNSLATTQARRSEAVEQVEARIVEAVSAEDLETTQRTLEQIARVLGWDEAAMMPRGRGRGRGHGRRNGRTHGRRHGGDPFTDGHRGRGHSHARRDQCDQRGAREHIHVHIHTERTHHERSRDAHLHNESRGRGPRCDHR